MAGISFNKPSLGVNTDRVAASSRSFLKKNIEETKEFSEKTPVLYTREVPGLNDSPFVEENGKRYYLNAPRGTYLNILV